ncbi:MAG TPA: hypothetical protein VJV21_09115 [Pyrinomonadaceae bacterium]|nr:hypothetical protein [Pyrinomonadaceae bacterium]
MNRLVIIAAACMLLLPITAFSQTRTRRSITPKRSTTQTSTADQAAEIRMAGATKVADQVKILTRFLYLLGGVAKGIEQIDEAAKKNEASPTALQQNEQNKTTVKTSLRNVREGLDALEIYFRSTPGLQSYYLRLAGSASGAADAEAQAAMGQFDQSGRTLLGVVNRLTDVLLIMR